MAVGQLGPLGKKLPWPNEVMCIIEGYLWRPTPLCMAVGDVIKEMGEHEISCHCACQEVDHRLVLHFSLDCKKVVVREMACRMKLLEVRFLDPGLPQEDAFDILYGFKPDYRDVHYMVDVNDPEAMEAYFARIGRPRFALAQSWYEISQCGLYDMASLRHAGTFWPDEETAHGPCSHPGF